jgi:MFS family permease
VGLGGFLNFGLNHLNGKGGLAGWRWMFLVQGLIAIGKSPSREVWSFNPDR